MQNANATEILDPTSTATTGRHCVTFSSINSTSGLVNQLVYTTSSYSQLSQALQALWIFIAIVGFIFNTAQIFWIISNSRKSVIDVFIVSLSVIDLHTCCFNIPFQVAELVNNFDWSIYGDKAILACKFHWYFRHFSTISGSVMIALIAVSRYLAVSNPMSKLKERYSQMCINSVLAIIVWVATIALTVPLASMSATVNTKYYHNMTGDALHDSSICYEAVEVCEVVENSLAPTIYGSLLFFVVPLTVLIVSYSSLIRILIKRNHKDELAYSGKKKHFVKSIVNSILGLFYIILVAPKGIYNIIKISKFPRHEKLTEDEKWLDLGLYVLATTVVISNPVIYSFLTPRFFKYVKIQSRRMSNIENPLRRSSVFSTLSTMDWNNINKHLLKRKCRSHERLYSISEKPDYSRQETSKTILSVTSEATENTDVVYEEDEVAKDLIPIQTSIPMRKEDQVLHRAKILTKQKSLVYQKLLVRQERMKPIHAVTSSAWLTTKMTETRLASFSKPTDVHYATL